MHEEKSSSSIARLLQEEIEVILSFGFSLAFAIKEHANAIGIHGSISACGRGLDSQIIYTDDEYSIKNYFIRRAIALIIFTVDIRLLHGKVES